ncbi:MAG: tetratricopeptide repeat protein, partial [Planctomycetota bacterium]
MTRPPRWLGQVLVLVLAVAVAAPAKAGPLEDGQKALDARAWADAADAFRRVLEKDPKNADAAVGLAQAVIEGGFTDAIPGAEESLQQALEAKPKDHALRLALGRLYLAKAASNAADPTIMKFTLADAQTTFRALLDENGADEDAVAGLARALYDSALFDQALEVLDGFLAEHPSSNGKAPFWQGQVLYLQAQDAYRAAGKLDGKTRDLFEKARKAYAAAAAADPRHFDAWMQLGYATQYLGQDLAAAQAAYEKAMDLDPQSSLPLKGIAALYTYSRPKQYGPALQALVKAHPKNAQAWWFLAHERLGAKDGAQALEAFEAFQALSVTPQAAWTWMAKAWEVEGDDAKAETLYVKALKANPDDAVAADALDRRVRAARMEEAGKSPAGAKKLVETYEPLFAMAPNNAAIRNNAAFILPE